LGEEEEERKKKVTRRRVLEVSKLFQTWEDEPEVLMFKYALFAKRSSNREPLFWGVTQRTLVVTDIFGQTISPITNSQAVLKNISPWTDSNLKKEPMSFSARSVTTLYAA
jgi:hypothetical protein